MTAEELILWHEKQADNSKSYGRPGEVEEFHKEAVRVIRELVRSAKQTYPERKQSALDTLPDDYECPH